MDEGKSLSSRNEIGSSWAQRAAHGLLLLLCLTVVFASCRQVQPWPMELAPAPCAAPSGRPAQVAFLSIVCHGYERGGKLDGWLNTRTLIRESFKAWHGEVHVVAEIVDPSRDQVRTSLTRAGNHPGADLIIVYLGMRQTRHGEVVLSNGETVSWSSMFPDLPPDRETAERTFYFLDACHATATLENNPRLQAFGTWLVGSKRGELIFQRDLGFRGDFNFSRRHPAADKRMRQIVHGPPYRFSHTGLVWLVTMETRSPPLPVTAAGLTEFLNHCTRVAEQIRGHSRLRQATVPAIFE